MVAMLFRCMRAELIKLKRSFIWIVFLVLPILSTLMGCFNYLQNIDILTDGWYALWTQATLFYSNFFFPPLIALYCAYLWRLENFNHNRNALMTSPIPISVLYSAQFLAVTVVVLLTQLYVGVLYVIGGLAVGMKGLPPAEIFYWLLRGSLGGLSIAALITASVVVVVGSISYIGLIVPNIVAMFKGDKIRGTLVDTALFGVIFVLVCDMVARVVITPYELPIELIVGIIGSVLFIGLLLYRLKHGRKAIRLGAAHSGACASAVSQEEGGRGQ